MGKTSQLSVAIAALILGTSLVACDDGRSGAEAAAQQFATAVSALDVGPVAFDGKDAAVANDQLKNVFAAL
ncbi:MAG: penicillin-binding protein, partial [Actinomycetes bacterium]